MIVIVSNGKEYSDHRLYYIDSVTYAAVEELLKMKDPDEPEELRFPRAKIVGTCEHLVWLPNDDVFNHTPKIGTISFEDFEKEMQEGWI